MPAFSSAAFLVYRASMILPDYLHTGPHCKISGRKACGRNGRLPGRRSLGNAEQVAHSFWLKVRGPTCRYTMWRSVRPRPRSAPPFHSSAEFPVGMSASHGASGASPFLRIPYCMSGFHHGSSEPQKTTSPGLGAIHCLPQLFFRATPFSRTCAMGMNVVFRSLQF